MKKAFVEPEVKLTSYQATDAVMKFSLTESTDPGWPEDGE